MVRFFARSAPGDNASALTSLAIRVTHVDGPVPLTRWEVEDANVALFLDRADRANRRVFHDATLTHPDLFTSCEGGQIFGTDLQHKLATRSRLGGAGALIIIVDGGTYQEELTGSVGITFEPAVTSAEQSGADAVHGTMCLLDAYMGAPGATFGDMIVSTSAPWLSSDLLIAFTRLLKAREKLSAYNAWIVSVSLQVPAENLTVDASLPSHVRLSANVTHDLWTTTTLLVESGFDLVIAAGNDGCSGPPIGGLALHPSATTIGAVDGAEFIDPISSRGMAVKKPDFSCYANFLWSQLYGGGTYDAGTSAATALAAGLIASRRAADPGWHRKTIPPVNLREALKHEVLKTVGGHQTLAAHDTSFGWGII